MKGKNFFLNIIFFAVISGGLCGYVLGVIAGILPIFHENMGFSNAQISFIAGAILLGCVISSIYTGVLNDWIGRKYTMSITFLFYAVGAAIFCFSNSFSFVYVSRFLQGVGFGMAVIVIPVYLTEISSKLNRGKVIASFQLALTGGVLLSNVFNLFLATNLNWRAVIAVIFIVSCFLLYYTVLLPESPRWLFSHGGKEKAKNALECLNIKFNNKQTWDEISILADKEKVNILKVLTKRSNVIPILIVTAAVSLNQLSGINGFLQCSITILKQTGISSEVVGLIGGISITGINFIATILTLIFIERLGRRKILKIGTFALLGLTIHIIDKKGKYEKQKLGPDFDNGETYQVVVRRGNLFAATLNSENSYCLAGCTLAPGFEFEDWTCPEESELLKKYPQHKEIIKSLSRV